MSAASSAATMQFLKFFIGDSAYCLRADAVRELCGMDEVQALPSQAEDAFVGFIWSRGRQTPVHVLADILRLSGKTFDPERGKVIVLEGETPQALWVERVSGIVETPSDALHPLSAVLAGKGTKRFAGLVCAGLEIVPCLDGNRLWDASANDPRPQTAARPRGAAGTGVRMSGLEDSGPPGLVTFASAARPANGADLWFGLSQSQTLEICGPLPVTSTPGAAAHGLGVTLWRNRPIAVIDLERWLGFERTTASRAPKRFVVARSAKRAEPLAFLAYGDVELLAPPFPEYRAAFPEDASVERRRRIRGWFERDRRSVAIPDLDALFESQTAFARA
jgi:chemotaxis signal transduction protein